MTPRRGARGHFGYAFWAQRRLLDAASSATVGDPYRLADLVARDRWDAASAGAAFTLAWAVLLPDCGQAT